MVIKVLITVTIMIIVIIVIIVMVVIVMVISFLVYAETQRVVPPITCCSFHVQVFWTEIPTFKKRSWWLAAGEQAYKAETR